MKQKGFTLIELLVVIAIIGILSAVVLAGLSNARAKGSDVSVKSAMAQIVTQAELYYSTNSQSYANFFTTASNNGGLTLLNSVNAKNGSAADATVSSAASTTMYYVYTGVPSGTGYICSDPKGVVASTTGVIANALSGIECTR